MTKPRLIVLAALASLALLVPASSAEAAVRQQVPFCGSLSPNGGYLPKTLAPGKACTFFPVAVNSFYAPFDIVKGGNGAVCTAVVKYPPGFPSGTPLDPRTGGPGSWRCTDVHLQLAAGWAADNGFSAVYGQPVVLNYSTATIKTRPIEGVLWYY
jgi:hypothetical protein